MERRLALPIRRGLLVAAALFWCVYLRKSDALLAPYVLTAILAVAASGRTLSDVPVKESTDSRIVGTIGAVFLSGAVVLANYGLFPLDYNGRLGTFLRIANLCLMLCSGYVLFRQIFRWIYYRMRYSDCAEMHGTQADEKRFFWLGWLAMLLVYMAVMCLVFYPGLLTPDSVDQITQIQSGIYTNHHPFYHSQLIRLFFVIGCKVFGNTTGGVAAYTAFSIITLSGCFAYAVGTIYNLTGNKKLTIGVLLWYLLMPFHITYSFTVWKDVPFAAAVTFFLSCGIRIIGNPERKRRDLVGWTISAMGICLLRSNGLLAFAAGVVVFALFFRKKEKKLLLLMITVVCACFVLKYPVLKALQVAQPDTIEALSIPLQQISRTVLDGKPLTQEEKELLEQVVDVERIPETYAGWISDPMKELVREKNNQQYLKEHKMEYLKLYASLGAKNFDMYIHAWVDQTKGYWNGGYHYWCWYDAESAPYYESGVALGLGGAAAYQAYLKYAALFSTPVLQPLSSIGLYFWLLLFAVYAAWLKRDRRALFTAAIPLLIVGTLLVATPVYAEFRYAYGVICAMPVVAAASFWKNKSNNR